MDTFTTVAAHGPGYYDGPGGFWPIFPIFWLLCLIAVIAVVVAFQRRRWARCDGAASGAARLAERFAAGEIDEDEYRARRAVLDEKRSR